MENGILPHSVYKLKEMWGSAVIRRNDRNLKFSKGENLRLLINGENKDFEDGLSLDELIHRLGVRKETVVAEVNRQIVQNDQRSSFKLSEGDQVELIQFVGGG
jgi:sulfur carrier protein